MSESVRFIPRPDAHATPWHDLLSPIQIAIQNLLVRIQGSVIMVRQNSADNHPVPDCERSELEDNITNCFLVYGDRGTGKSTVLLNAAEAVRHPEAFFARSSGQDDGFSIGESHQAKGSERFRAAYACAEKLVCQGVVWLDVLDLEPLPPKTNLLTILLTRVRNALDEPGVERSSMALKSRFEESTDGARQQLTRLISDATMMWEDISETDTRTKANRQVVAADIYVNFRSSFLSAMKALAEELALRGRDEFRTIVLPIDNIDRSTEHLYSIIKLAQMVSCRQLLLVMAGDRVDVESFLERAYWKELIRVGNGAGGGGKTGMDAEDEAFVMARHQATAAAQNLLPQSHRVEVQKVRACETLEFCPSRKRGDGSSDEVWKKEHTIRKLFERLKLHNGNIRIAENEIDGKKKAKKLTLLELFDAKALLMQTRSNKLENGTTGWVQESSRLVSDPEIQYERRSFAVDLKAGLQGSFRRDTLDVVLGGGRATAEDVPSTLTYAAGYGLHLSASRVLDLWQLAYWEVSDLETSAESRAEQQKDSEDVRAERIVRTMLRNIIAESNMSNTLGHRLQNRIILRNAEGGTVLDFFGVGPEKKVKRLVKSDQQYRFSTLALNDGEALGEDGLIVRTTLKLNQIEGGYLYIRDKESSAQNDEAEDYTPALPARVTAWLIVLHDIVRWAKGSVVINFGTIPTAPWVEVQHEMCHGKQPVIDHFELRWSAPDWGSFLMHDIFRMRWEVFFTRVKGRDRELRNNLKQTQDRRKKEELKAMQSRWMDIRSRFLVCGWVACVLETFFTLSIDAREQVLKGEISDLAEYIAEADGCIESDRCFESIGRREYEVIKAVVRLYDHILDLGSHPSDEGSIGTEGMVLPNRQTAHMRDWFENDLPLFLIPLYAPIQPKHNGEWRLEQGVGQSCEKIKSFLETITRAETPDTDSDVGEVAQKLCKCWAENAPFIQARINANLCEQLIVRKPQPGKSAKSMGDQEACQVIDKLKSAGYFGVLDQIQREDQQSRG